MQDLLIHPQHVHTTMQAALPAGLCNAEDLMMPEGSEVDRDAVWRLRQAPCANHRTNSRFWRKAMPLSGDKYSPAEKWLLCCC